MRILASFVVILVSAFVGFGQTKKPTEKTVGAVRTTAAIKRLQKDKKDLEKKLAELGIKYDENYYEVSL